MKLKVVEQPTGDAGIVEVHAGIFIGLCSFVSEAAISNASLGDKRDLEC